MHAPDRLCVHGEMNIGGARFLADFEILIDVAERMRSDWNLRNLCNHCVLSRRLCQLMLNKLLEAVLGFDSPCGEARIKVNAAGNVAFKAIYLLANQTAHHTL